MSATRIDKELIATFCAKRLPNKFIREHPSEYWNMIGDLEALFTSAQHQLLDELMAKTLVITDGDSYIKSVPVSVLEKKRATLQGGDK